MVDASVLDKIQFRAIWNVSKRGMIKKRFLLKTVNLTTNDETVNLYALVLELSWTWSWWQSKKMYGVCVALFFGGRWGPQWCLLWASERSLPRVLQGRRHSSRTDLPLAGLSPAAMVAAPLRLCQPPHHRKNNSREMAGTVKGLYANMLHRQHLGDKPVTDLF